MTKEMIVNYIINSNLINDAIKNIHKKNGYSIIFDDFKSFFHLQILEMKDEKLINAYNGGYIDWLCVKMLNNSTFPSSPLYRTYNTGVLYEENRNRNSNLEYSINLSYKEENRFVDNYEEDNYEEQMELLNKTLNKIYPKKDFIGSSDWYHYFLFNKYWIEDLTYKQIEAETKINYQSVRFSVMETLKQIKKEIKL